MKTVAYLRVSTGSQDLANQKMAVLDYARRQRFTVGQFVEAQVSSRKTPAQPGIEDLLGTLMATAEGIDLEGDDSARMQKLLDVIEDLDDVQDVYHNAVLSE